MHGGVLSARLRHRFRQMLCDIALAVAVGREDLVPGIRALYPELPERTDRNYPSADGEDGDHRRDALYLDPMRQRHRWDVFKDFALPVLAIVLSVVALIVSILD